MSGRHGRSATGNARARRVTVASRGLLTSAKSAEIDLLGGLSRQTFLISYLGCRQLFYQGKQSASSCLIPETIAVTAKLKLTDYSVGNEAERDRTRIYPTGFRFFPIFTMYCDVFVKSEAIRRPTPGDADTEGEDYLEAEIDSTDTLIPAMTELFGEALIAKRYNAAPQAAPAVVEEVVAPPGTVPRRHVPVPLPRGNANKGQAHTNPTINGRRFIGKQQRGAPGITVPQIPVPPGGPDSPGYATDVRLSSVASFATFIADNDKRKPLIGLTGLKAAANAYQNAKKGHPDPTTSRKAPPKHPSPIVESVSEHLPKQNRLRQRSESFNDDPPTSETVNIPVLTKSTSTSVIPDLTAPINGRLGGKIPDDANPNEYNAAFGSRPKITRTPEHNKKSDVFIF
uniref:Uncharacterized protein n=1 Tax=Panagrellus redivivus TaxID=6233 RepID=A0A7E4VA01_PANRE